MADVLVVEGAPLVREMIVEALLHAGLRVTEAASAAEALQAVEAAPRLPAVLVTDVALERSGMGGLELASELRQRSSELGVIYLGEHPDVLTGNVPGGREHFVTKPFEPARLARLVCGMIPPCPNPPRLIRGRDVIR